MTSSPRRIALARAIPLAPPSPRGGGQLSSLRDSRRCTALRFALRYGSSDSLLGASPSGPSGPIIDESERREHPTLGQAFTHESILGTVFTGRLVGTTRVGDRPAVVPEVTGRAYLTAISTLVLTPDDPFPGGFLL